MVRRNKPSAFNVKKALVPSVTEEDIKQKYGWGGLGVKFKTPEFSLYETMLVILSLCGLGYITLIGGISLIFKPLELIAAMGIPTGAAWTVAVVIGLVWTETFYEFLGVKGHIKKATFVEVLLNKILSAFLAVVAFVLYPIGLIYGGLAGLSYLNMYRTNVQRQKNFEAYLEAKKKEIAQNEELPPKQRTEITFCKPASGVDEVVEEEINTSETTP